MARQIFQTESRSRWTRFKWGVRLLIFVIAVLLAVFITMLALESSPALPFRTDYRRAVSADKPFMKDNRISAAYKSFRDAIKERKMHNDYSAEAAKKRAFKGHGDSVTQKYVAEWTNRAAGIRAAWYVSWDPQSYLSLKQHARQLNLVIPEWFFIHPRTGQLEVKIDHKAYAFMRRNGLPIMPMLTNNVGERFESEAIGRILRNPARRRQFITQLRDTCAAHRFAGINIDLEELDVETDEIVTTFVKEVAAAFHDKGMYVTQDIMAFNSDYNVEQLSRYADYLFVMAYDEHMSESAPGPVSSQRWIEAVVDDVARKVPNEKIVLGLAGYGYDWNAKGNNNRTVTYAEALSTASDTKARIRYDEDTYNLDYSYADDEGEQHTVFFTDAATNWNTMRFGAEYGLAGFSLWRLGSEDSRLWSFYGHDMTARGASGFDMKRLADMPAGNTVHYFGDGEVLNVMDTPHRGRVRLQTDEDVLVSAEEYVEIPTSYQLEKFGKAGPRELLLTFDDGPDARWTPKVLEILRQHGVHAAFFMVGLQMEKNLPLVRRVYDEGHLIGNHTFTHHNVAENSPERTFMELKLTRMLLESVTGHSTVLFRAPYNADSDPTGNDEIVPIVLAAQRNYVDVGESIDPNDWQPGVSADEIFHRVVKGVEEGNGHIILLHDAGGITRKPTLEALPRIIEYLKGKGYTFTTLDKYLGQSPAQLMPSVPKGEAYYAIRSNLMLVEMTYAAGIFVTALFMVFLALGFVRLFFMLALCLWEKKRERRLSQTAASWPQELPQVTIVVPAYNEEINAVASLQNLLKQDYPCLDIVFVDDGSTDDTYNRVKAAFTGNPRVKVFTKKNGGKASALNDGVARTEAQYVVCIDADTKLRPDAVRQLMSHFFADSGQRVGAVAGNVKVGNCRNLLTRWQAIEYTTSQNFDRRAYAAINAITVVPGAIGAFRKCAIEAAGGFTTDTLAEDCDLTMRILKAGYRIGYENRPVARTEAPETLRQFVK